jgi:hypothetical protein
VKVPSANFLRFCTTDIMSQRQTKLCKSIDGRAGLEWSSRYSWKFWRSNPGGSEIFHTLQDQPWSPHYLLHDVHPVSFLEVKRPEPGVDKPSPSSAEVDKRVNLYLYSTCGLSIPVLRWNLAFWQTNLFSIEKFFSPFFYCIKNLGATSQSTHTS